MDTKEIKINCPEGFEIDKENSTFECIKFKPIKNKLPKTWEEFCKTHPKIMGEVYFSSDCICHVINVTAGTLRNSKYNRNILPSKELAEAMLALCQLIQLRDCYNNGWIPNYQDDYEIKYCIIPFNEKISTNCYIASQRVLTFKTAELRNQFLENFIDLIEIAKPLL